MLKITNLKKKFRKRTIFNDISYEFKSGIYILMGENGSGKSTTINPSYNINLTINGGTDDPDTLAQTVANKVREMLSQYDNQQAMSNQQTFFANETSGLLV